MRDIFKIGLIGVMAAILALTLKKERTEISILIGITAGLLVFGYILSEISVVLEFLAKILEMIAIEETYYMQLLKMLGIAYVAEFTAAVCRDAGQQSLSGMIELFAKISIVVLSIPGLVFLVETMEQFL